MALAQTSTELHTPKELRTLMLRLRNLPAELVERILIEVPLPQLLSICSRIVGFTNYCQDRNFWLARARSHYRTSLEEFARAELTYMEKLPAIATYLNLLLTYSSYITPPQQREMAVLELADLENEIRRKLLQLAQTKASNTIFNYAFGKIETDAIFPVSSSEEALLTMDQYLNDNNYDTIIDQSIRNEIDNIIDSILKDIKESKEIIPLDDLIDLLTDALVASFDEGKIINIKRYYQKMPRLVHVNNQK